MKGLSTVALCVVAGLLQVCFSQPAKEAKTGNLGFAFGSQDEIPAAFFDNNPAQGSSSQTKERKVYPPCQDGSGGLCVEEGQCPPELKPETNNTMACGSGLECCFGPAQNDKSCASRGGECMTRSVCGHQPIFREANDCDTLKGELCCILI